jgi:hypothetical protein
VGACQALGPRRTPFRHGIGDRLVVLCPQ